MTRSARRRGVAPRPAACAAALLALLAARSAQAQVAQSSYAAPGSTPVEEITVRPTPLSDMGDDASLPTGGTTLRRSDIDADGTPDLLDALGTDVAGLELDSASGNPLQPTLFYNGSRPLPCREHRRAWRSILTAYASTSRSAIR